MNRVPATRAAPRRLRGDRGQAFVVALVVLFTFTGAAAVWLARDVNQRVSDRSALQSVAFQAARAGAQQIDVGSLRDGSVESVVIDEASAREAAAEAAHRLAEQYDLEARIIDQGYDGGRTDTWAVTLALTDAPARPDGDLEGDLDGVLSVTGVAHAEVGG